MMKIIQQRIQSGNKAYYATLQVLKSKDINRNMKIYKTLIRPVVTYSSEAWVLKKGDKNNLRRFERKIYGPVKQEQWRIINNEEIHKILQKDDIVRFIKARIDWLGHVERMDANRMPWKMLYEKIYTKRVRGRPKFRWCDDVREDLRIPKVKDWRSTAMDRDAETVGAGGQGPQWAVETVGSGGGFK
jgi:hypothetical protein